MNSLLPRLFLGLLALMTLVGGGFFLIQGYVTEGYYEELTQRLNAPIASYISEEHSLIVDGRVNDAALRELAHQAMIINPTVEVYLLGTDGTILAHALPPQSVILEKVDVAPIQALVGGSGDMPLRGNDPRTIGESKVFSAAEVTTEGQLRGYLYVVLGGQQYDALAQSMRGSYVQRQAVLAGLALLLLALATGLLIFGALTCRLRRLTRRIRRMASDRTYDVPWTDSDRPGDELAQLDHAFTAMTNRIDEQLRQLTENDRLRRELVSSVSHDLRTPLSSMQGYVETLLIKDDTLTSEQRTEYLQTARRHGQRLNGLIGDLFELSKLESASMEPAFEDFSITELLQDTVQEFELDARAKSVVIDVHAEERNISVRGDISLIQRVIENLLRNALQHTPTGGRIRLSVARRPDAAVNVSVSDTGCGMPTEDLDHLFDRFYSLGNETDWRSTGLGLAIVKRILDLHGSRIIVSSEVDRGTCFRFDLPAVARVA